jgi:hypothetical protein
MVRAPVASGPPIAPGCCAAVTLYLSVAFAVAAEALAGAEYVQSASKM